MNKIEQINKLIDEAIDSVDNIKRASPMPFLLTRINARLNKTNENVWEKMLLFIGRPAISIPALAMLIIINVLVIVFKGSDQFTTTTEQSAQADEFSYTVSTIYDIENTEP
ncbi:MAG: hypothetical protein ABI760_00635 [Ferruginibacter sp.]